MYQPCIEFIRIWDDIDFFELHVVVRAPQCMINLEIYTTNEELSELSRVLASLPRDEEILWTSGSDLENSTHFLRFRFFTHMKRGRIAIEINADNKRTSPYSNKADFYIITEPSSLDQFANEINRLIREEVNTIKGIMYSDG